MIGASITGIAARAFDFGARHDPGRGGRRALIQAAGAQAKEAGAAAEKAGAQAEKAGAKATEAGEKAAATK